MAAKSEATQTPQEARAQSLEEINRCPLVDSTLECHNRSYSVDMHLPKMNYASCTLIPGSHFHDTLYHSPKVQFAAASTTQSQGTLQINSKFFENTEIRQSVSSIIARVLVCVQWVTLSLCSTFPGISQTTGYQFPLCDLYYRW